MYRSTRTRWEEAYGKLAAAAHGAHRILLSSVGLHEASVAHGMEAMPTSRLERLAELFTRPRLGQPLLADTAAVLLLLRYRIRTFARHVAAPTRCCCPLTAPAAAAAHVPARCRLEARRSAHRPSEAGAGWPTGSAQMTSDMLLTTELLHDAPFCPTKHKAAAAHPRWSLISRATRPSLAVHAPALHGAAAVHTLCDQCKREHDASEPSRSRTRRCRAMRGPSAKRVHGTQAAANPRCPAPHARALTRAAAPAGGTGSILLGKSWASAAA